MGRTDALRALRRLGDWRLDKAREHVVKLHKFAQTKEDHDFIDRFSGWLLFAREVIDEALGNGAPASERSEATQTERPDGVRP